jgi:transposase-like protein
MNKADIFLTKKEKAVELWTQTHGHISNICRALGISRTTFYKWMEEEAYATRLLDAEAELNDEIRDVLVTKAAEGDMTAVIFYLKSRHPDFKEHRQTNIQVNNYSPIAAEQKNKYGIQ